MDTLFVIILSLSLNGDSSYTRIPTTQCVGDTLSYAGYEMYLKGLHGQGEYIGRDWEWLMEVRRRHGR